MGILFSDHWIDRTWAEAMLQETQLKPGRLEIYYAEAISQAGSKIVCQIMPGCKEELFLDLLVEVTQETLTDEELQDLVLRIRERQKWRQIICVFKDVTETTLVWPHCEKCGNMGYEVICGWCEEGVKHGSCDDTYRRPCSCPAGRGKKMEF